MNILSITTDIYLVKLLTACILRRRSIRNIYIVFRLTKHNPPIEYSYIKAKFYNFKISARDQYSYLYCKITFFNIKYFYLGI